MDALFSTQGIMIMLLGAYAVAMWMFLTSAPKVHTILVSDLARARAFYEGQLELPIADVPLAHYYGYESLGGALYPSYIPPDARSSRSYRNSNDGLWYQLHKNVQIHVVPGATPTRPDRDRHICFHRDCVEQLLLRIQMRGIKHKVRNDKPLVFLVKDLDGRVMEVAEVTT